jgi:hypothetical protein
MKKLYFSIAFVGMLFASEAQTIQLNGGTIVIQNNGTITADGNLLLAGNGTLQNDGTFIVKGNLTNDLPMTASNNGTWLLNGTTMQTISGTSPLLVKNVDFNNATGFTLGNTIKVDGVATFTNGIVNATNSAFPLVFASTGTVNPVPAVANTNHVNGFAVKEGTGAFTYPVGNGTIYQKVETNLSANSGGMRAKYNTGDIGGTFTAPIIAANSTEYWDLTPLGTATGSVTLYWDGVNDGGTSLASDRRVLHKIGANLINEGNASNTGNSLTSVNTISTWSPFTIGNVAPANPLPIDLLSFTGKSIDEINQLKWETSLEINASHFDIERSTNANYFVKIGLVAANNSSKEASNYTFDDIAPSTGENYYRLKMVDIDSKYKYSKVIQITNADKAGVVGYFYPNPSDSKQASVDIIAKEAGEWSIVNYDLTGKVINYQKKVLAKGFNKVTVENLAQGETLFMLQNKDVNVVRKIVRR